MPKRTLRTLAIIALLVNILPLLACSRTIGTEPCRIPAQQLPSIRGIRLGMTPLQLSNTYSGISHLTGSVENGSYGLNVNDEDGTTEINIIDSLYPTKLEGVSSVTIRLFEGKVYNFEINYDPRFVPKDHDEFVRQVSKSLNMPDALWKFKEERRAVLDCSDSTYVRVNGYSIEVVDLKAFLKTRDYKNQKEDQRGNSFKP